MFFTEVYVYCIVNCKIVENQADMNVIKNIFRFGKPSSNVKVMTPKLSIPAKKYTLSQKIKGVPRQDEEKYDIETIDTYSSFSLCLSGPCLSKFHPIYKCSKNIKYLLLKSVQQNFLSVDTIVFNIFVILLAGLGLYSKRCVGRNFQIFIRPFSNYLINISVN